MNLFSGAETLESVVRVREGQPYYRGFLYKEYMGILPGPRELSVIERCPYYRGFLPYY